MKGIFTQIVVVVLLALILQGAAQAGPPPSHLQPASSPAPGGQSPDSKLAPALHRALRSLAPGGALAVIVVLEDQADLSRVSGATRAERLEAVVRLLQRKAGSAQVGLRALLSARQEEGAASGVIYYWVFNGLAMTARAELIYELAVRPEIRRIGLDEAFEAPPLLQHEAADSGDHEWNLGLVGAPGLWHIGLQGQDIVVANMDSGVSGTHPDLVQQWRGGSNSWFDPYGQHPTVPTDLSGHGTWTMGVMVGRDASGTAVGMAPQARWIAVKIFDDSGHATSSAIHQGFQWLLDPDDDPATADAPHVVNNSWSFQSSECDLAFQLDLQALRAAGILPIFAAGNSGPAPDDVTGPASPAPDAGQDILTPGQDETSAEDGTGSTVVDTQPPFCWCGCGIAEASFLSFMALFALSRPRRRWRDGGKEGRRDRDISKP